MQRAAPIKRAEKESGGEEAEEGVSVE